MSADIQIRPFHRSDAEGLARVYLESAHHHAAIDPDRYTIPGYEEVVVRYRNGEQHPDPARAVTLVAHEGRDVVGFIDAWLQRPIDLMHRLTVYCYIAEVAVSERHRSQGVGASLMEAAETWGRQQGAEYTSLDYNTNNPRAASFYQRMGYHAASVMAIKRL